MTGIRIAEWVGGESMLAGIADVYATVFAEAPYLEDMDESRVSIRERILRYAATAPAFRLLVALDDDQPIGFVLAMGIGPGDWWRDRIAALMSDQIREQWLGDGCWCIAELAVARDYRRSGIARELMTAVSSEVPYATSVLGCYETAAPARSFYAGLGWEHIATDALSSGVNLHVLGRRSDAASAE
ncbi:GNAT family N-acetyltransferase [Microbacterium sp. NPDC055903]